MKKFEKICKAILKLTPEDFAEGYKFAEEQENYIHPLKMATAKKTQMTGFNNKMIVQRIEALQKWIKKGGDIAKS